MFDKEGFINEYVDAVKKNDTEKQAEVLGRLTADESLDFRIELINGIKTELQKEEGHEKHIEFLDNQINIINAVKMHEDAAQDSASEEAKDEESKAEEVTQDVAVDTSAAEAETPVEETDISQGEAGGYAPATEEEAEKSEKA